MAIKDSWDVEHGIGIECEATWNWLRQFRTYKNDHAVFEKLKSKGISKRTKSQIVKRWGFYPLVSPFYDDYWYAPIEFIVGIGKLLGFNAYDTGIRPLTLSEPQLQLIEQEAERGVKVRRQLSRKSARTIMKIVLPPTHYLNPPDKMPNKVIIEANAKFSPGYVANQVKAYLQRVHNAYGYSPHKSKGIAQYEISLRYIRYVLQRLNWPYKELRRELTHSFGHGTGAKISPSSRERRVDKFLEEVRKNRLEV